jgi:multidrug efflux pump subunit AcrA (membrane-fusion protein)
VSVTPDPQIDINLIEQARKQINRLAEEIAQLSEQDLAPPDYYGEFMQRLLTAIAAPAGAIWLRTAQGNLQLQYQINLRQVGLDRSEESRQSHDELLRQAIMKGQPGFFPPQSGLGGAAGEGPKAGNPTDYVILLAPIVVEKQVAGIIEVWQDPHRGPEAQRGFLHFMVRMAGLASSYTRNHQLRQMTGQQQVWTQLEAFARQVHGSLNPTEVAYLVANEGRRLVECDRVSVAIRRGKKTTVEAISGSDVVEKRSNLVQLMRALFDQVLKWGEKLVYSGVQDETLPPGVHKALDEYLAESNSKLLVVLPLRDEREADNKKPARSCVMMECFEPNNAPEQLVARLEVVGKHAVSGLYNAAEHRRIPMRFLWVPIAKVQEGLGGKARAILAFIGVALVALIAVLVFVQGTLKVEGKGQLVPKKRGLVYAEMEGGVEGFPSYVKPGAHVTKGKDLVQMYDPNLGTKITELQAEIMAAEQKYNSARAEELKLKGVKGANPNTDQLAAVLREKIEAQTTRASKSLQLRLLQKRTNANLRNPGEYWVKSPMTGIILSSGFREKMTNRRVKPNEPILRIGDAGPRLSDWEIELKIPQDEIGLILRAFQKGAEEIDVELQLRSHRTRKYKGKLDRRHIASEAVPDRDPAKETGPVVLASVRIHGDDIAADERIPRYLLLADTEVDAVILHGGLKSQDSGKGVRGANIRAKGLLQVQPEYIVPVYVEVPGILEKILVREGQQVKKGTILAKFRNAEMQNQEEELRSKYEIHQKRAALYLAHANDAPELEKARAAAESDRDAARKQWLYDRQRLKRLFLRAPRAGTAISIPKVEEIGTRWEMDQEKPFCSIGDTGRLRVLVPVPPADYELIRRDLAQFRKEKRELEVTIRVQGRDSHTWKGLVTHLPQAEAKEIPIQLSTKGGGPLAVKPTSQNQNHPAPQNQVYLIGVTLVDPDSSLCPGTLAEVTFRG